MIYLSYTESRKSLPFNHGLFQNNFSILLHSSVFVEKMCASGALMFSRRFFQKHTQKEVVNIKARPFCLQQPAGIETLNLSAVVGLLSKL